MPHVAVFGDHFVRASILIQALETHGAAKGSYLTLKRLGRCHPWCEGGLDPVPPKKGAPLEKAALFAHLCTDTSSVATPAQASSR